MKVHLFLLVLSSLLHGDLLYETDFDEFPAGDNNWAGNNGWISNDTTSGAQSIDSGLIPALLQTASLGFNPPNNDFTFVALNVGYDHVATGVPEIEIDTLLGIEDSTNNRRDEFFLSIYNSTGDRLASIRFDNQDPAANNSMFGIWREDGDLQFDTLLDFIPGELFNLFISLNLETNTWSADIAGIPLFENAELTAKDHPINFGFLAFEWDLSANSTFFHGDNYLLIADISIRSVTPEENPPLVVSYTYSGDDQVTLSWPTKVGFDDQVQYSTDLVNWIETLPNSTYENITTSSTVNFSDPSTNKGSVRFYRVKRTLVPQ